MGNADRGRLRTWASKERWWIACREPILGDSVSCRCLFRHPLMLTCLLLPPPPDTAGASPTKVCKKGQAPVVKGEHTKCRKCRPNTYSDDGLSCKRCPQGTSSRKGAAACKT